MKFKELNNASKRQILLYMSFILMALGITCYLSKLVAHNIFLQSESEFQALATESEKALIHRMASYNHALLGGTAFFQSSAKVTVDQWRQYVETIDVKNNFPGIHGLGWIKEVKADELDTFLEKTRKDIPNFSINPATENLPFYISTFIEPREKNRPAVGLNIAFEKSRRDAAELAKKSRESAISKKITLIQDEEQTPGFLLLHPIYKAQQINSTSATVQENFLGWIYAPLIARYFLNHLTKSQGDTLNIRVYDGDYIDNKNLIYSSYDEKYSAIQPAFAVKKQVNVMQQDWLVVWDSTLAYEQRQNNNSSIFIILFGSIFTLILGVFLFAKVVDDTKSIESSDASNKFIIPCIFFIIVMSGTYYLYKAIKEREMDFVRQHIEEESKKIEQLVTIQTQEKLRALKRLAQRWEVAQRTPFNQWKADVKNYIDQLNGIMNIQWVDKNYRVQWVEPLQENQNLVGKNIVNNTLSESFLKNAIDRNSITLSSPERVGSSSSLSHYINANTFSAYAPLTLNNSFDGFIVGVFDIKKFLSALMSQEINNQYATYFKHDNKVFFINNLSGGLLAPELMVEKTLQIYDQQWNVKIVPTQKFVEEQQTSLPIIILIAGFLVALLASLTVRYIIIAKNKSNHLWHREQALQKLNSLNSGILQSTTSLIIAIDAEGKHIVFNHAAEKALGYTKEEVLKGNNTIFLHDMNEIEQRAIELSQEYKMEFKPDVSVFTYKPILEGAESRDWTMIRKNGTCFRANITVTPLRDSEEKIVGFLGVIEDVTERLRQQQIIKASEETFRSAMEHASIGMALISTKNKLLKVNEALCTLLGYSKSELMVRDLASITHPEDMELNKDYIHEVLNGESSSFQMEKRFIHSSGKTIWTLVSVSLVRDAENNPKYFIKQVQNITDRKEMERMKSEFISIVSHELRTPLTSIRGSLGLMVGTMTKDIPEKANRLIEIAYKNSERLILLINDILDIDKIASGQMRFDIKPENLNSLMQQAVEANNDYAKKFNVRLVGSEADSNLVVKVDSARFLQIMANLISNAVKFSNPDGQVDFNSQVIGNKVRISVKDYGMGIPEEFHSKIFSKFSQADSSATRVKGGTGLGLHITKQLIEYMNGQIGFDTETGKGTIFWIDFPVSNENAQVIPLQPKIEGKKKILICEDEKEIAELMQQMLNNAGFESDIASSIFEAKRILKNKTYSAMTLDIVMPMGNGIDFIRELRDEPSTSNLPIIVVSGHSNENKTTIEGSALGIAHLLQKPIDENVLISCLKTAVESQEKPRILHIEDDVDLSKVLEVAFHEKVELVNATTLLQAQEILKKEKFSLIVLDLGLPDGSGLQLLSNLHLFVDVPPPVVILSAHETSQEIQNRVSAALVKSRMSEEKIVETIQNIIKQSENKLAG